MKPKDAVTVSTSVAVDPETAFDVFTTEVDAWWRTGPKYRMDAKRNGAMRFEPYVGGRFLEVYDDATRDAFEIGKILVWKPGDRLVFEWRGSNFEADQKTEVEVRFEPSDEGTRVTLEHRGWDALPQDAPARHRLPEAEFYGLLGGIWVELLASMRRHTARRV